MEKHFTKVSWHTLVAEIPSEHTRYKLQHLQIAAIFLLYVFQIYVSCQTIPEHLYVLYLQATHYLYNG